MRTLRLPAARPYDVVGLGEVSVDYLCVVPRIPGTADKVRMSKFDAQGGGQIATAMVACQRLGLRTKYLGKVGDDRWGPWSIQALAGEGVDVAGVRVVPGASTQLGVILIDEHSGERTVIWQCDDAMVLHPAELGRDEVTQGRVFHVDATGLAGGLEPLRWAREAGAVTSIDIDHLLPTTEEALRLVDLCVVPAGFPEELTGKPDLESAMRAMQRMAPDSLVCVTLGVEGCAALDGEEIVREPAWRVRAVDTTACGDVFHAAFIYAALAGYPLRRAMRFANAAAALKTRALGGRPGIPTLREVEAFLRSAQGPRES